MNETHSTGSNFKKLIVWQQAMDLIVGIYKDSEDFPKDERFGLTSQLRRASTSVAANIAEGSGRSSSAELGQFASIAVGSLREVETFLEIALRLGYVRDKQSLDDQCASIARLLARLRASLVRNSGKR